MGADTYIVLFERYNKDGSPDFTKRHGDGAAPKWPTEETSDPPEGFPWGLTDGDGDLHVHTPVRVDGEALIRVRTAEEI